MSARKPVELIRYERDRRSGYSYGNKSGGCEDRGYLDSNRVMQSR
jgi:hypothetical protein